VADADRRRTLHRMILMGLLAGTGLAVFWHPLMGLIGAITIAITSGRNSARGPAVRRHRRSERLVAELLTHLPDDHVLINDVVLPGQRGTVDHVVIGPCGVVVIEPRQYAGSFQRAGSSRADGHESERSASFSSRAALTVKDFLAERHPDLRRSALRYVDSVVVFTDPRSPLEVYRARSAVVRYSELLQFIGELGRQRALDAATAATLARTLSSVSAPRAVPSRQSPAAFRAAAHRFLST
jgi:Nuclease-related domain